MANQTDEPTRGITRRAALAGAGGVAATAILGGAVVTAASRRMPAVYLPHGGGPWPFMDPPMGEPDSLERLTGYLRGLASLPSEKPKALLVISAHWEARVPAVMTHARPPMLYDYSGFPKHTYELSWPAPGAPSTAKRVRELLSAASIESADEPARGYDHGTFVPMMLTYPQPDIPTVQLSLQTGLDPARHIAIGRALSPLLDEGVYVIGSGMSFHNLRMFFGGGASAEASVPFDQWLAETIELPAKQRDARLADWRSAPGARVAHPREEHLLPLMVVAGVAGDERGTVPYRDVLMGARILAAHFG